MKFWIRHILDKITEDIVCLPEDGHFHFLFNPPEEANCFVLGLKIFYKNESFFLFFNPIKVAGWGATNQEAHAQQISPSSRLITINIDIFPDFPDRDDQCKESDWKYLLNKITENDITNKAKFKSQ